MTEETHPRCVVVGTAELGRSFSAWYIKDDRLIALDAANDSRAYAVAGRVILTQRCPEPALVTDPNVKPKVLLHSAQES